MEAGRTYATDDGESGVGKESLAAATKADAYNTPAERGGWALVFQSHRQSEDSTSEVIA